MESFMRRFKPYFESKFPISYSNEVDIIHILKNLGSVDKNGTNGEYFVLSTYFDTADLDFYRDKIEGEYFKIKIRLRYYKKLNSNKWLNPKLELKMRSGDMVTKFSKLVSPKAAKEFCENGLSANNIAKVFKLLPEQQTQINKLFRNFFYPTVNVSYKRKALNLNFLHGLRVTIDKDIKAEIPINSRARQIIPKDNSRNLFITPSQIILEVKSDTTIPSFLLHNLEKIGVNQESISKYALALNSRITS